MYIWNMEKTNRPDHQRSNLEGRSTMTTKNTNTVAARNANIAFEDLSNSTEFFVLHNFAPVVESDGVTIKTFIGYHSAADFKDRLDNGYVSNVLTAPHGVARFTN